MAPLWLNLLGEHWASVSSSFIGRLKAGKIWDKDPALEMGNHELAYYTDFMGHAPYVKFMVYAAMFSGGLIWLDHFIRAKKKKKEMDKHRAVYGGHGVPPEGGPEGNPYFPDTKRDLRSGWAILESLGSKDGKPLDEPGDIDLSDVTLMVDKYSPCNKPSGIVAFAHDDIFAFYSLPKDGKEGGEKTQFDLAEVRKAMETASEVYAMALGGPNLGNETEARLRALERNKLKVKVDFLYMEQDKWMALDKMVEDLSEIAGPALASGWAGVTLCPYVGAPQFAEY